MTEAAKAPEPAAMVGDAKAPEPAAMAGDSEAPELPHGDTFAEIGVPMTLGDACCNPRRTCQAFCNEFKSNPDSGARMHMFRIGTANARWPLIFGTSTWFSKDSPTLLSIRVTLALIFLVHWTWSLSAHIEEGFWFIYLTHWSLTTEVVYLVLAAYTTYRARQELQLMGDGTDSSKSQATALPGFVTATWVMLHVANPAALLVFVLYWALDNPIWAMTHTPGYLGFFVHGINFVLMQVDLVIGNNVFYLKHVLWFFLYFTLYLIWTLVHFGAKVGTYNGCDEYPKNECPIYGVLDWHSAQATATLGAIIMLCVAPLCQFPLWWCVHKRRAIQHFLDARQSDNAGSVDAAVVGQTPVAV